MLQLKFMEPQSRWVIGALFKRNFDAFTEPAQRRVNWSMLLWDIIIAYVILQLIT